MGFEIGSKIKTDGITLDQLKAKVAEKYQDKIESIFNQFNTTKAQGGESEVLDADEQMHMLGFFKSAAGEDADDVGVSRRSFRRSSQQQESVAKYKDYKRFMEAFNSVIEEEPSDVQDIEYSNNNGQQVVIKENDLGRTVRTNQGNLVSETLRRYENDNTVVTTTYSSDDPDALPDEVSFQSADGTRVFHRNNELYTEEGKPEDNLYVMHNNKPLLASESRDGFTIDYEYDDDTSDLPTLIQRTNEQTDESTQYVRTDDGRYVSSDYSYYSYDSDTRTLTEVPVEEHHDDPPTPAITKVNAPTNRSKVAIARDWKNQRLESGVAEQLQLNNTSTVEEVLDKLLSQPKYSNIDASKLDRQKLLTDLRNYNPSVFNKNDGVVWANANWSKLDFPPDLTRYLIH